MKRPLLVLLFSSFVASIACAQDYEGYDLGYEYEGLPLRVEKMLSLGSIQTVGPAVLTMEYSNMTTFLGTGVANGGAALQSGNTITKLAADDCTPTGANAGEDVVGFRFCIVNLNAVAVTFRPRVRFWNANGAGGGPGTFIAGFTFLALSQNPGAAVYMAAPGPTQFPMPGTKFWAGVTFDNDTGATGATASELDGLGQGLFNPPMVGSSADEYFLTAAAGSNLVNNPAGSLLDLGGNPVTNFGWEFTVDAPTPVEESTWSRIKAQY